MTTLGQAWRAARILGKRYSPPSAAANAGWPLRALRRVIHGLWYPLILANFLLNVGRAGDQVWIRGIATVRVETGEPPRRQFVAAILGFCCLAGYIAAPVALALFFSTNLFVLWLALAILVLGFLPPAFALMWKARKSRSPKQLRAYATELLSGANRPIWTVSDLAALVDGIDGGRLAHIVDVERRAANAVIIAAAGNQHLADAYVRFGAKPQKDGLTVVFGV